MNLQGKMFNVKIEGNIIVKMWCKVWTDERRVFEAVDGHSGYLDLDWMEYSDQAALGRIVMLTDEEEFDVIQQVQKNNEILSNRKMDSKEDDRREAVS